MAGMIVANVWRTYPYAMILSLAAIVTVPPELNEAAKVDGANAWQRFFSVTLPLIRPTLLIALIILSVNAINMIELPLILTGGGPIDATDLLGLRVYREAFVLQNFGFASAIAIVMFGMNALISIAYIRVVRNEV
jgi:multiple sugar transport system permease protein